jgi:hypothetical protein
LADWQRIFTGDAFDFDYHFMWAHQKDPGQVGISKVLHEDIKQLHRIGLRGYMSCQVQRSFFPNGLGLTTMGRALWNRNLSFGEIAEDYFVGAYGRDGVNCQNYLTSLSNLYHCLDLEQRITDRFLADRGVYERIYRLIREFEPIIERNLDLPERSHSVSWNHLRYHKTIWLEMTRALEILDDGDAAGAREHWQAVRSKLWENEEQVQNVLDVYNFVLVFDGIFIG